MPLEAEDIAPIIAALDTLLDNDALLQQVTEAIKAKTESIDGRDGHEHKDHAHKNPS